MRSRPTTPEASRQSDSAWVWAGLIEFAVLVGLCAILITAFAGAGFWPWLVMAGAIALGWVVGVVVLIPRSAPHR